MSRVLRRRKQFYTSNVEEQARLKRPYSVTNAVKDRFKYSNYRKRLYKLKYHPVQAALWKSTARFNIVHAGRRSGKTEIIGKRKIIRKVLSPVDHPEGGKFFVAAPTRDQVKRIYWKDLKLMIPGSLRSRPPSESLLIIYVKNGNELHLLGMDRPERIEGTPWEHGVLDEIGNMKPNTWGEHVRPALADRLGTCDFIGVPEGRNHYFDLCEAAKEDTTGNWAIWHWLSADILPPKEIEQAKRDLDLLTYQQEYEGSFVSFVGRAYYNFDQTIHVGRYVQYYDSKRPLVLCFDFNVSPGVASIIQELPRRVSNEENIPVIGKTTTAVIDEVYIEKNSNTVRICNEVISKYRNHEDNVICYGDATGGAKGTAKVRGSDWDLIKQVLYPVFGHRLFFNVPKRNPSERSRINAVNSRFLNSYNEVHFVIDGNCKMTIKDFEGVRLKDDGSGAIDKTKDVKLSHLSDAIGYYINKEFPIIKVQSLGEKYFK